VCGLYEFTNSSIHYVRALRVLEDRIISAVNADRQGYVTAAKEKQGLTRTIGFIDEYEDEIDRLVKVREHIDGAQKRLADLKLQLDHYKKIYNQRAQQYEDVRKKLFAERQETENYAKKLRALQDQLHAALIDLSEAGDRNFRLFLEIRELELSYLNQKSNKGGKKQP
jgi:chromosome segregation ATPase